MRFTQGWDAALLRMLRQAKAAASHPRVVLSTYPPGYEVSFWCSTLRQCRFLTAKSLSRHCTTKDCRRLVAAQGCSAPSWQQAAARRSARIGCTTL